MSSILKYSIIVFLAIRFLFSEVIGFFVFFCCLAWGQLGVVFERCKSSAFLLKNWTQMARVKFSCQLSVVSSSPKGLRAFVRSPLVDLLAAGFSAYYDWQL